MALIFALLTVSMGAGPASAVEPPLPGSARN